MRRPTSSLAVLGGFLLATALVLPGCVSRGAHDEVVAERDALAVENRRLQTRSDTMIRVAAGLRMELRLRDAEVAQMKREQEELADEVARWAILGAIEMQLLADGLQLILPHDVLFESGSPNLSKDGRQIVKELVAELGDQPYQIAVLGHSDNMPIGASLQERFPSNWDLAGARATSVVRVMEQEGIPVNQLVAISRGEGDPIASNDTAEGRARNRRIDVRIRPVIR